MTSPVSGVDGGDGPGDGGGLGIVTQPMEYLVHVEGLPDDAKETWGLVVAWRGGDQWAVLWHRECLGTDGAWSYEGLPSSRTDKWRATHRFPLDEALRLAAEHAPNIKVNGYSPADIVRRHAEGVAI